MSAQRVMPSRLRSETFIFAVLVVSFAFVLPVFFSASGHTKAPHPTSLASSPSISILPSAAPTAEEFIHWQGVPLTDHEKQLPFTPISHAQPHLQPQPQLPSPPSQQRDQPPVVAAQPPVVVDAATKEPKPAPITYLIPYVGRLIAWSFRLVARLPSIFITLIKLFIIYPLSYPAGVLLAVLRPLILLLEIIYILTLRTPFAIISWFIREAIYPLYVFTGVAVLLGTTVGISASVVPKGVKLVLDNMAAAKSNSHSTTIGRDERRVLEGNAPALPEFEYSTRSPPAADEFEKGKYWARATPASGEGSATPSAIGTRIRSRFGL